MAELELSIIMPCLNEARTVGRCVRAARAFLERTGIEGEVLVGDNGSTDGSQALATQAGARVVAVATRGYGAALTGATAAARGRFVIMGDADDSYDFGQLDAFVAKLREGHDLVMGNRFAGGIEAGAMPWKNRWIGNPVLSGIGRLFFKIPCRDFHCGLRAYRRDCFWAMGLVTTGMEFASEMVIKAAHARLRIAEVPTSLRRDGRDRPPHLRPWRDGWRHLSFMLIYSPKWLFLIPGLAAMTFGLTMGTSIWARTVYIGNAGLDVGAMVFFAALTTLGFQAVLFAVLSKVYAVTEGLLPPARAVERFQRIFSVDRGVVAGAGLFTLGLALAIVSVVRWWQTGLGPQNPAETLRTIIPSALFMVLGVQLLMSSFLLGLFAAKQLIVRHAAAPTPDVREVA